MPSMPKFSQSRFLQRPRKSLPTGGLKQIDIAAFLDINLHRYNRAPPISPRVHNFPKRFFQAGV
jgi:hypothetical protein